MNFDKSIIDAHQQKDRFSCIPSAIEMILKLLGIVDENYYELQIDWNNRPDGGFHDFHGRHIEGLTFEHKFGFTRDSNFPLKELFQTIDGELASGRYVIISLPTETNYHMYVVYENKNKDYFAFSKDRNNKTVYLNGEIKNLVCSMQGTDILVYKA